MRDELGREIEALPQELKNLLSRHGFDRERFLDLADRLLFASADVNRVSGRIRPPDPADLIDLPNPDSERGRSLRARGLEILRAGQAALVVLAGGMATRMGGVVKALVEALPGRTFLDLRLGEIDAQSPSSSAFPPFWLMTSHSTDEQTRAALGSRLDGYRVATFAQRLSLRLTPEGTLFRTQSGGPSEHAPGHGDLPDALRESGLLDRFVDSGGRVVTVANLDNLGATLDPLLLGLHAELERPVICEVVDKVGSDRGGIPVRLDDRLVVLEEFRLPEDFDAGQVRVFNTNTFHFDARALRDLDMDWTYFRVEKKVEGRPAIQFERLLNEVTSHLDSAYVRVPRVGAASRFLPVKDREELTQRRGELEAIAESRGMLGV